VARGGGLRVHTEFIKCAVLIGLQQVRSCSLPVDEADDVFTAIKNQTVNSAAVVTVVEFSN